MELLFAVVIASFVGSLHCVGMCGPLVAFAVSDPQGRKAASPVRLHAAYHGGRLLTYAPGRAQSAASSAPRSIMAGPGSAAIVPRPSWPGA